MHKLTTLFLILTTVLTSFSQISKREYFTGRKKVNYEYNYIKNDSPEYPQLNVDEGGKWIRPIAILQGVEVSYSMETDGILDLDGWSDQDFDIYMFVRNTTNKPIYFNNVNDKVATINFPGEVFNYRNGDQYFREFGGKIHMFAGYLDKKGSQFVMEPGKYYLIEWWVNRDKESWAGTLMQRKMRPIWLRTSVPNSSIDNSKDRVVLSTNSGYALAKSEIDVKDGLSRKKIRLDDHWPLLTPNYAELRPKISMPENNGFTTIYESSIVKVEYSAVSNNKVDGDGMLEYNVTARVTNKTDMFLTPATKEADLILKFIGGKKIRLRYPMHKIGTYKTKDLINVKGIQPNQTFGKTETLKVYPVSGEIIQKGGNYSFNRVIRKKIYPVEMDLGMFVEEMNSNFSSSKSDGDYVTLVMMLPREEGGGVVKSNVSITGYPYDKYVTQKYGSYTTIKFKAEQEYTTMKIGSKPDKYLKFGKMYSYKLKLENGKKYYFLMKEGGFDNSIVNISEADAKKYLSDKKWMKPGLSEELNLLNSSLNTSAMFEAHEIWTYPSQLTVQYNSNYKSGASANGTKSNTVSSTSTQSTPKESSISKEEEEILKQEQELAAKKAALKKKKEEEEQAKIQAEREAQAKQEEEDRRISAEKENKAREEAAKSEATTTQSYSTGNSTQNMSQGSSATSMNGTSSNQQVNTTVNKETQPTEPELKIAQKVDLQSINDKDITLVFTQKTTSKNGNIRMEVKDNMLNDNGEVIIKKGEVVNVTKEFTKAFIFGKPGKFSITLNDCSLANGSKINLEGFREEKGLNLMIPSIAGIILVGPFSLLIPGGNAKIEAGTQMIAKIKSK